MNWMTMHENRLTFLKTTSILVLFVLNLGFFGKNSFAQNDTEERAKELVQDGKYDEALVYFEDLVNLYPADKELNYFLGMCLVETEQFSEKAKNALQTSLGDDTPKKSLYYLAQCFHAENNFAKALNYYQQFDDEARRKEKRTTKLDELMEQCKEQINPFPEPVVEVQDTIPEVQAPVLKIPKELKDSVIHFQVNSNIKYLKIDHFKDEWGLQAFLLAWQVEQELQELVEKTNQLRDEYDSAFASEKQEIADKILTLEKETYAKNKDISQNYLEARLKETSYWKQADPLTIRDFQEQVHLLEDSIRQAKEAARRKKLEVQQPLVLPDSLVKTLAPTEALPPDNGVRYKIQIGAYSRTPPDWVQRLFKKLAVIRKIDQYTDENGVTVYTVGELKSYEDALKMQSQVRLEGIKDAIVAAYKDGERIPVKEAREITED